MYRFELDTSDGKFLSAKKWLIDSPIACVCLVHGMSEYMRYYGSFAEFLNRNKINVYGFDHRGHGESVSSEEEIGHIADEDAFILCSSDVNQIVNLAKKENPQLPLFLLGHSMGSLIIRLAMVRYNMPVAGVLLSGTAGHPGLKGFFGLPFVKLLSLIKGKRYRSKFVEKLVFGRTKRFEPMLTHKDWLSREEEFLLAFTSDAKCNKVFTVGFYYDLGKLAKEVNSHSLLRRYKRDIPWFLFSGSEDIVGDFSRGVKKFYKKLVHYVPNSELKIYPEARHVVLCETNKAEVYADVFAFIEKVMSEKSN